MLRSWRKVNDIPVHDMLRSLRKDNDIPVNNGYADDFLHFSNKYAMYANFREQVKQRFDIKSGPVEVSLGNRIYVKSDKFKAAIDQTSYNSKHILTKFGLGYSHPASTLIVKRLV